MDGTVGQRGDLVGGPRRAQRFQQGHGVRNFGAGMGGGPVGRALVAGVQGAQQPNEVGSGHWIAMGAGLLVQAGCLADLKQAESSASSKPAASTSWSSAGMQLETTATFTNQVAHRLRSFIARQR